MNRAPAVRVAQERDTAVTCVEGEHFCWRYAYARSADSKKADEPGQDYLVLQATEKKLAFAVCDGVSQSFMGDLAARHLGESLVAAFLDERVSTADGATSHAQLLEVLSQLVEPVSQIVETFQLSDDLSLMLREVLEEKRQLGSESTFATGVLDADSGQVLLAWMGDTKIWLWRKDTGFVAELQNSFRADERWSTQIGPVGQLHVYAYPFEQTERLLVFSDGLSPFEDQFQNSLPDGLVDQLIERTESLAGSDDVTFLEIWPRQKDKGRPTGKLALAGLSLFGMALFALFRLVKLRSSLSSFRGF